MKDTILKDQEKKVSSMHIELIETVITISGIDQLKRYHLSQFEYYGFRREGNFLSKRSELPITEIVKITTYLDKERIAYALSKNLTQIIQQFQEKKQALNSVFEQVKAIKEEAVLDEKFTEFQQFTTTLPRKLKPHQLKSAYHFYILKNGANFSVPGSGKTSTILAVYEKYRMEGKCNLLFIVGPPSCFQPWKNEFLETLGRVPDALILSGGNKNFRRNEYQRPRKESSEIYLSTFHTALNDTNDIIRFLSQANVNAFMVVDEAHYMKQLGGSWASSLLEIGKHAVCKGILTGTPIPKSYKDLFNLFDFLWEGDSSLTQDDKIQIEIWEKQKKAEEIRELLERKVGPLFYRVRKKDLGLMPAKFHTPIIVKMNGIERQIYDLVQSKILDLDLQDYYKNENVLSKLWRGRMIRLRQATSYPGLLTSAIDDYSEQLLSDTDLQSQIMRYNELELPGKLQALTQLFTQIRQKDKKVLIWSSFVGTLELIKHHFNSLGYRAELIYGKTPVRKDDGAVIGEEKTRESIRDEFLEMDSGLDILIANPAACAESISLHKTCFHAIYYDLSYNCSQYLQSLDRIHRVGGSENQQANYYFLQYENSIDQDIRQNLETKAQRMYDIIEQDYSIYDLDLGEEGEDDAEAYQRFFSKHKKH